ncbi:hypothetical protein JMN32_03770 [Fulvivirga sp. 29W222]|uniref:Uncharacterized protein n=1 Tax=Fulvivirga marina TaxID=2494733 RepID=A0A937FTF8_9BACT|nr:hypothetical protein [Fulvivirga marina]MBL6445409.1 hypothetical protein [Fulvivirga marina]
MMISKHIKALHLLILLAVTFSLSEKARAQSANLQAIDLIQAFGQGKVKLSPERKATSAGNCVSIGYIKASIEVFGLNNIFEHTIENNVHSVILKDHSKVSFTSEELKSSIEAAGFSKEKRPDHLTSQQQARYDSIYDYANIIFCAIVKRYQAYHKTSFTDALDEINLGKNVRCYPKYLGLQYHTKYEGWKGNRKSRTGEVAWFKNHVVYVSKGLVDFRGEAYKKKPIRYPKRIKIYSTPFDQEQYLGEKNCL